MTPGYSKRALAALLTATVGAVVLGCRSAPPGGSSSPAPEISTPTFELRALRGEVVVLTFGYTSCPDVCPTTLAKLNAAKRSLGPAGEDLEVVFVSVDPERDHEERLAAYLRAFDPGIHAVSLRGDALARTLDAFGVVVRKRLAPSDGPGDSEERYTLDHSAGYWLIDRRGDLRARVAESVSREALARAVRRLLEERPPLRVEAPVIRLTPNGLAAGYLTVVNSTRQPDRLLGVRTSAARRAELHEVVAAGGGVRMEPRPEGFEVPPDRGLTLAPSGKHLMLYDVVLPGDEDTLPLALRFEHAGTVRVTARVERAWLQ